MIRNFTLLASLLVSYNVFALPQAPANPEHPGSKVYTYGFETKNVTCSKRTTKVYYPTPAPTEQSPVVVFGHGQALDSSHYEATLQHLAKKGITVVFPKYDTGFFDQNWQRMGADYIAQTECALKDFLFVDKSRIVFSGHSKGAYVASIAAGNAFLKAESIKPNAVVLFATAGVDTSAVRRIAQNVKLTVVFAQEDTIVSKDFSKSVFDNSNLLIKQFINLKSYPQTGSEPGLKADHMFPLSKSTPFGGGPESALHYYGTWKWLVSAAFDLSSENGALDPYIYGDLAIDKGIEQLKDEVQRNY
jgi:hypothetical protein